MPKVRDAMRPVEREGRSPVRIRDGHRQCRHPRKPGTVTIAGLAGDDLPPGTWASILKQAGLKR
ncbi:MAG: type II toxin-antitoxin system HicA family toxin [Rhodospirillaceae bacterium]|nr:type II toxin-antitoxin system HicA family toxin [Rhodospirillaceae bacterium]